jgi:hypothetical protein
MSQAWLMPVGDPMVEEPALALMLMHPASIVPGIVVVRPGNAPFLLAEPLAVVAATSRGVAESTPEYLAMPAAFAMAELSIQR